MNLTARHSSFGFTQGRTYIAHKIFQVSNAWCAVVTDDNGKTRHCDMGFFERSGG